MSDLESSERRSTKPSSDPAVEPSVDPEAEAASAEAAGVAEAEAGAAEPAEEPAVPEQRLSKAQQRAAAKAEADAIAEAARKRRQRWIAAASAVAVIAVAVGVVFLVRANTGDETAPALPPAPTTPPPPSFPPVPPGSDPALATKPAVKGGSGKLSKLQVTELIKGTGDGAKSGQTVNVNYVGVFYKNGQEFDSSWSHSQTLPYKLGSGGAIKGFDQGLVGAKVGSRLQLDIPSNLAFGDKPANGAPAGDLRFVVDVLAIQ